MKPNPYTQADCGCYIDGARGVYSTDAIVDFAREHGGIFEGHDATCEHSETADSSEFAGCEFASEFEDEASEYMNEYFPVEGCYWGRNENGDWGLWEEESN